MAVSVPACDLAQAGLGDSALQICSLEEACAVLLMRKQFGTMPACEDSVASWIQDGGCVLLNREQLQGAASCIDRASVCNIV